MSYCVDMSRLIVKLREYVIVNGKADLCRVANVSDRQLTRYLNRQTNPPDSKAYKLALQCGFTHEEALELIQGGSSEAKRTA